MCMYKQFKTYKKDSVVKGNKPEKDGRKIWIDYKHKFTQCGIETMPIEDVKWFPYKKYYLRNGVRSICVIGEEGTVIATRFIKLNWFEIIIEWFMDLGITSIMVSIGVILSIILSLKEIFS